MRFLYPSSRTRITTWKKTKLSKWEKLVYPSIYNNFVDKTFLTFFFSLSFEACFDRFRTFSRVFESCFAKEIESNFIYNPVETLLLNLRQKSVIARSLERSNFIGKRILDGGESEMRTNGDAGGWVVIFGVSFARRSRKCRMGFRSGLFKIARNGVTGIVKNARLSLPSR